MIPGFRHGVGKVFAILEYYATWLVNDVSGQPIFPSLNSQ